MGAGGQSGAARWDGGSAVLAAARRCAVKRWRGAARGRCCGERGAELRVFLRSVSSARCCSRAGQRALRKHCCAPPCEG